MVSVIMRGKRTLSAELLRSAIQNEPDFHVALFTESDDEMLSAIGQDQPNVILLLQDPGTAAEQTSESIKRICSSAESVRVVVVTDKTAPEFVIGAFSAGARGVFSLHGSSLNLLCKCIARVHEGQIWATTEELTWVMSTLQNTRARQRRPNLVNALGSKLLSRREEDVVALLVEGLQNREIAQTLNLSEHTVKNYLFRIYDKLGISSRTELLLYVMTPAVKEAS